MVNWITFDKNGFKNAVTAINNFLNKPLTRDTGVDLHSPKTHVAAMSAAGSAGLGELLDVLSGNASAPSGSESGGGAGDEAPAGNYKDVMNLINDTAAANNQWSADQALRQMEFQLYASNTAHQREVKDLIAAGLNPVLSAGGSGASTPAGAMGQTDTSNTRLLAEVALSSIQGLQNTAVGVARAASGNTSVLGKLGNSYKTNPVVKKVVDTAISQGVKYALGGK